MPQKRSDAKPNEKLLHLYTLLMLRGEDYISLNELVDVLDCSKATVIRLLASLEASGFAKLDTPLIRGREQLYRMKSPEQPILSLDARELTRLSLCRNMLLHILPKGISSLLEKKASPAASAPGANAEGVSLIYGKGHIDYEPHQERYSRLLKAVQKKLVCELTYRRGLPDLRRTFFFAPMRLIIFRESISFLGWEVPANGPVQPVYDNPLSLYLQRCLDVRLTRRSSSCLPPPPAAQQGPDAGPFGTMGGDVFRVSVRFAPSASAYVHDRTWSCDQEMTVHNDGSLTLDFGAQSEAEVVSWVLGFGSAARVLAPDWLRKRVLEELEAAALGYAQPLPESSSPAK